MQFSLLCHISGSGIDSWEYEDLESEEELLMKNSAPENMLVPMFKTNVHMFFNVEDTKQY